nr:immunoglobulin heavy chain junction region [Macaca mulatta]MOV48304.1 immunoglobulin heavy chain junction region [Macaca mulatta]MOV48452.1 immunoglobulin heavy chain junction region [Macaca mulatta]
CARDSSAWSVGFDFW